MVSSVPVHLVVCVLTEVIWWEHSWLSNWSALSIFCICSWNTDCLQFLHCHCSLLPTSPWGFCFAYLEVGRALECDPILKEKRLQGVVRVRTVIHSFEEGKRGSYWFSGQRSHQLRVSLYWSKSLWKPWLRFCYCFKFNKEVQSIGREILAPTWDCITMAKNMATALQAEEYKVIIIGALGVGKTSLLLRYVHDTFEDRLSRFVSEEKKTVTVHGKEMVLDIWDTAG